MITCPDCGKDYHIGEWYRCPHEPVRQGRGADVTWPGGRTFENLGDTTVTFYSPAEKYQYMKRHGYEEFVRHVTAPGTDKSPHTTSWAAIAPETLANAKALLERVGQSSSTAERPTYINDFSVTITDVVETVRGSLT